MTDLIGTVRREEHEDGFSIWVKVAQAQVSAFNPLKTVVAPEWLCVYSTDNSRCGDRINRSFVERADNRVTGTIPGTPADPKAGPR